MEPSGSVLGPDSVNAVRDAKAASSTDHNPGDARVPRQLAPLIMILYPDASCSNRCTPLTWCVLCTLMYPMRPPARGSTLMPCWCLMHTTLQVAVLQCIEPISLDDVVLGQYTSGALT